MFTKAFWKAAGERAVRAIAAAEVAMLTADGADVIGGVDLAAMGWAAMIAAGTSVCLSVLGDKFGSGAGPSFTGAETTDPTG